MANLYDLKQLKCKTCGEPLNLSKAHDGVVKCDFCGSCFTLPKSDAEQKVLDFLSIGEHDLDTGKFDEAREAFAKVAELDKTEPEAYWGMALAEYKIQYLKDEVNNRLQPICHEINDKDFSESPNFLKALRYATSAQREEYERKSEEIDRIKKEFYKLKKTGLDYDCFICVKVSDENGERTADSEFAHQIYRMLKNHSFVPFYSEAVLKNVTGADYEAHILYALATSETMLVLCFDEAYLRTKWVKNEYTRFLKLVNDEEKESDSITLVYRGKPIEKLPGKNGKIQGIDSNEFDCSARILNFVDKHTPESKRRREEAIRKQEQEAKRKAEEDEALRKKFAEQEEEQRKFQEEIQRKLKSANVTIGSLVERGNQELQFKDFIEAKKFFDKVINADPKNVDAWWGLFLVDFKVKNENELLLNLNSDLANNIFANRNYINACNYNFNSVRKIVDFQKQLMSSVKWWQLFLRSCGAENEQKILESLTIDNFETEIIKLKQNKNYLYAEKFADAGFKNYLNDFLNKIDQKSYKFRELREQKAQQQEAQRLREEEKEKKANKRLVRNKVILSFASVFCFILGVSIALLIANNYSDSFNPNDNVFVDLLYIVLFFGGGLGLVIYLVVSIVKVCKSDFIEAREIVLVILNVVIPFVWLLLQYLIALIP